MSQSRAHSLVQCEPWHSDLCYLPDAWLKDGYAFQHNVAGRREVIEYMMRPERNGNHKDYHFVVFQDPQVTVPEQQQSDSKALLVNLHTFLFQHVLTKASCLYLDSEAEVLYEAAIQAMEFFLAETPLLGEDPLLEATKRKLRNMGRDLLRYACEKMRVKQFMLHKQFPEQGVPNGRTAINMYEFIMALYTWMRQIQLHNGFYKFSRAADPRLGMSGMTDPNTEGFAEMSTVPMASTAQSSSYLAGPVEAVVQDPHRCPVCFDVLDSSEERIESLSCGHVYHSACVDEVVRQKRTHINALKCPVCRLASIDLCEEISDICLPFPLADLVEKVEAKMVMQLVPLRQHLLLLHGSQRIAAFQLLQHAYDHDMRESILPELPSAVNELTCWVPHPQSAQQASARSLEESAARDLTWNNHLFGA